MSPARTLGSGLMASTRLSEKSNREGMCRRFFPSTGTRTLSESSGPGEGRLPDGGWYPLNTSTMEDDLSRRNFLYLLSPINACERLACGSKSIDSTLRLRRRAAYRDSNAATVVLPTPPFILITETHTGPSMTVTFVSRRGSVPASRPRSKAVPNRLGQDSGSVPNRFL